MSIKFIKRENELFIRDEPSYLHVEEIYHIIDKQGEFYIRSTFYFKREHIRHNNDGALLLKLADLEDGYWVIDKNILNLKYDLKISIELDIDVKFFIAERNISIFKKIDKIIDEPIIIDGGNENAIPIDIFKQLIEKFPTTTELNHYTSARVESVLGEYFSTMSPAEEKLNTFLNRKLKNVRDKNTLIVPKSSLSEIEITKFEYVYQEINDLLNKYDISIPERVWQNKIIDLIKFIFPKYIAVLSTVHICDFYTSEGGVTPRYIDLLLVDFNGNVDVLELKKPFESKILCSNPNSCRDNYIPHRELSTAIMQAEKYIFHLNKWGKQGEDKLTKKFKTMLPNGLSIKISNPKAIILLGRSKNFDRRQILDFEIIKRQFSHVADIMSYDDLLYRVGNILDMLKKKEKDDKNTI